jgi:hypothetical protein
MDDGFEALRGLMPAVLGCALIWLTLYAAIFPS